MCEFLERAELMGTPTEEVREWSTMTHRVVELCGPFPTPDDRRVEMWLHEESATRLLDICDRIDAEFDRTKAENAKLRELCEGTLVCYEPCNEHLDARTDCPLYDENEPFRCKKARLLRELGIGS